MKTNLETLTKVTTFYKIKMILHLVAGIIFVVGIIFFIVSLTAIFTTGEKDVVPVLIIFPFLTNFLFIGAAILEFANAILGIMGYMKIDSLPLVADNNSVIEHQALKTKGLISLICGWVFPLASIVLDYLIMQDSKKLLRKITEEFQSSLA